MSGQDTSTGGQAIELNLSSSPRCLPVVRAATEKMARLVGFDEDQTGRITLSIDEALANVIKHGYGGRQDQPITVRLEPVDDQRGAGLTVTIRDFGKQVDPAKIRSRDLADVRPGGLGVHIIQTVMDEVVYSHADGGGMKLRMVKYVDPQTTDTPGGAPSPPAKD